MSRDRSSCNDMSLLLITDHFSGPDRAVGPLRVCLCIRTIIFELNDL